MSAETRVTLPLLIAENGPCTACQDTECGVLGCETYQAVERIAAQMCQVSDLIKHEPDSKLRAVEAESIGSGYADVLGEYGARIEDDAWTLACGVHKAVAT